ncbi:hypothetical protein ACFL0D_07885 [Thermoproteota archaeon]
MTVDNSLLGLIRMGHRARIWTLLRWNSGRFFSFDEICEFTNLKPNTVRQGINFVKMMPRVKTHIEYVDGKQVTKYGFESTE